ncbi:MAG TPA: cytochrome c/FTR1 family iron permease [Dokdonella sp.]|uniref:cytochrome c/FTR1 family iron permease n=1 Tax=Dokdonella sp. TaxID=2291710 RepID=UPI002D81133D|nr:cytochrome c/FTR1 family iron permease [Dokdonella sp.]HET9031892.1 cytochrome c/FTR1 family iron permease [Dokdonella sp.]
MPFARLLCHVLSIWLLSGILASTALATSADPPNPRQTWQLLDYVAVDYAGAIQDGKVISEGEYAEMREFAATIHAHLAALPASPDPAELIVEADQLVAAVEAKAEPSVVADLAHRLADRLLVLYPVAAAPTSPPDLARASSLYAQQCAACHGASGHGDGPAAASLDPPPIAFTDAERAAQRSLFALYQAISQGVQGTSMVGYAALSEADRWALSFYVGGMAYSAESDAKGKALWNDDADLRRHFNSPDMLTRASEMELAKSLGDAPAKAITAFLRSNPDAINQPAPGSADSPFALARQRLADSIHAYGAGDVAQARSLALSSYLDGIEPIEPTLATRDRALMREIETRMSELRSQLGNAASTADVSAKATEIGALLDRAEGVLQDGHTDAMTAFVGSFTILLREGLEALLIVIGMIAFLRKAERREELRYVHAGWVSALLAGAVTWAVATYFVSISGANREVTEGLSALFAAAVLLSVGIWMHQKSLAGRWQQYLHEKMSAALTRRSAWFLFVLAFVAVYREVFETILFFIAMWSEQNSRAILGGLLAGSVVLALVAYWMLRVSRRLPISQFFSISSILIAVLAVVLVGKGIIALQEAGWVAQTLIAAPRVDWLGVYPSWQSLTAQLGVAIAAAIGFIFNARSSRALVNASKA